MGTPRKRTVAVAAGVSAALLASSTAFAVANGILGSRPNDKVGTFGMIEQRLVPAESPARTTAPRSAPPRVATTIVTGAVVVPATAERHDAPTSARAITPSAPPSEQEPEEHDTPKPPIVAPSSTTPTTHSTASTVPPSDDNEHETDNTEKDDD